MESTGIKILPMVAPAAKTITPNTNAVELSKQFGGFLNDAIAKMNQQGESVNQLNEKFAAGEVSDIHTLLIASQRASLGLEFAVQIRNKAIEAYQEIMRTQI